MSPARRPRGQDVRDGLRVLVEQCGNGACAAVAVGRRQGLLEERGRLRLPGGDLVVELFGDESRPIWITGPEVSGYEGEIEL